MLYKIQIFCPDDQSIIEKIVDAAVSAGAGIMGDYTHAYFIQPGIGHWRSGKNTDPYIGKPGESTTEKEVKIDIQYKGDNPKKVYEAIKKVHPYEEPAIEFIRLEEFE